MRMKTSKRLYIILGLVLIACVACVLYVLAQRDSVYASELGYSISYPKTMEPEDHVGGTGHTWLEISDMNDEHKGVTVHVFDQMPEDMNEEPYASIPDFIRATYDGTPPPGENEYVLVSLDAVPDLGDEAYRAESEVKGTDSGLIVLAVVRGGTVYVVEGPNTASYAKVVDSFRLAPLP